jgi:hypothetical protein
MPSVEEIRALIQSMPELDNPPPPPPEKKSEAEKKPEPDKKPAEGTKPAEGAKPGDAAKPADGAKPADKPKPADAPKPPPPDPKLKREKGKLHGPTWPDAEKVYDQILAGGTEAVAVVLDMVTHNDIGPAYKARYVAHALAVHVGRPGKEKERAAVVAALVSRLAAAPGRHTTTRAFAVRTLQLVGDASAVPALAPLLAEDDLADPAAQAMTTLGGDAAPLLAKALPTAKGRARLAILQALGQLQDPAAAIDAVVQAAAAEDETVRLTAIWSLARTGDPRAIDPIVKSLAAPEAWPRGQSTRAAFLLADRLTANGKGPEARDVYRKLIAARSADADRHVRQAAERGLAGM